MDTLRAFIDVVCGVSSNVVIGWVLIVGGWATFLILFIDAGERD
jgi:hypothetical protein